MQSFVFRRAPLIPFLVNFQNVGKFCLLNHFFSVQNMGHTCTNCAVFMWFKMRDKWTSALVLFLCFKTPKAVLTLQCDAFLIYNISKTNKLSTSRNSQRRFQPISERVSQFAGAMIEFKYRLQLVSDKGTQWPDSGPSAINSFPLVWLIVSILLDLRGNAMSHSVT